MKTALKNVAIMEAVSFLVLLAATVVKRTGGSELGVELLGPIHGGLFVVYVILTIVVAVDEKWRIGRTLLVLLCAVVPLGGFYAGRKLIDRDEAAAESAA